MITTLHAGRSTLRVLFAASAVALALSAALAAPALAHQAPAVAAPAHASARFGVEVVGQGPDVILIPGFGSSREVWRAEAERLKTTHRVHLVQLAGFAGQPWTHEDGPFVAPVVQALADYIADEGLDRPAVVGHSMGALVGLRLAQAHPDKVGRLMSVDSLPFFGALFGPTATAETTRGPAGATANIILTADEASFRTAQEGTARGMSRDPAAQAAIVEWSMTSDRGGMAAAMRDVMTNDARPGLAAMTTPVTAIYASDADGGAPAAMADAMWSREYAALPGVRLIRVDDSRHFIMLDQPERFAQLMDAFLAEN